MTEFKVTYFGSVGIRSTIQRGYKSEQELRAWWGLALPSLAIISIEAA